MSPEAAAQANRMEFERYKSQLARGYTKYQITDEKTLPDGTLAGSVVSLSECLRRVIRFGVPAEQAIRSATLIPAQSVGLGDVTGSLRPGKRADLVVMDAGWQVRLVMIGGRIVHRA